MTLPFAPEGEFMLAQLAHRFPLVVCMYPAIGTDAADEADRLRATNWEQTQPALINTNHRLVAISSDEPQTQLAWLEDDAPTSLVLCDPHLLLARDLPLPTARRAGRRVYAPLTLVVRHQRIAKVFQPAASDDAAITTRWILGDTS